MAMVYENVDAGNYVDEEEEEDGGDDEDKEAPSSFLIEVVKKRIKD